MFFDGGRISRNRSRILKTAFDGLLAADQKQNKTKPNRTETKQQKRQFPGLSYLQ